MPAHHLLSELTTMGCVLLMTAACASKPCVSESEAPIKPKAVRSSMAESDIPDGRAVIALDGQYCEFYYPDVKAALQKVSGVKALDFQTVKNHVVVTYESGNVSPVALLSAVSSVKGDGYFCKGKIIPG